MSTYFVLPALLLLCGLVGAFVRAVQLSRQCNVLARCIEVLESERRVLETKIVVAVDEDKKKVGWLDHQEQEVAWLRAELEKRPKITRKTYKILTFGVKATGKTSLTLKWANPLIDLGLLQGTKIERYERTVSNVLQKDVMTEHVFEVGDWGGEHIVDAQHELIMAEIHGLLIVVDLAGRDGKQVERSRIQEQLHEFQYSTLKYFFSSKTMASCKTVVLFINKSDLLPGTPADVEEQAKKHYAPLIDDLMRYSDKLDIRVFVGSASYGHSTHLLFSHFVERILPQNAYDRQLVQHKHLEPGTPATPSIAASAGSPIAKPEKTAPLPVPKFPAVPAKRPAVV